MKNENDIKSLTAHLFRENSGKMIAYLTYRFGIDKMDDIADIVQESFESALIHWKYSLIPDNPSGWLMQVAKNKMINRIQSASYKKVINTTDFNFLNETSEVPEDEVMDSQLKMLLFFVQLPISDSKKIILTLHYLCGFGYAEIGNALNKNEETVKKTIFRSKGVIQSNFNQYDLVSVQSIPTYIEQINLILYLLFNEGYKTTKGKVVSDPDLCFEAIRLLKWVHQVNESNVAVNALLALMFFNVARFPARIDEQGLFILLEDQDRSLWNKQLIQEGYQYLNQAKPIDLNAYYIEALISSLHCTASSFAETNWHRIVFLYQQLEHLESTTAVFLNKIIAQSYYEPIPSLIETLNEKECWIVIDNEYLLYLSKAFLLKKNGDKEMAYLYFEKALDLTKSEIDKKFIIKQMML